MADLRAQLQRADEEYRRRQDEIDSLRRELQNAGGSS